MALPILARLLLSSAPLAGRTALFVDHTQLAARHPSLQLRVQRPIKGPVVIRPTAAWESWAVFAYNSVVAGNGTRPHRMYYDCIEGSGVPPGAGAGGGISQRRICLAESADGVQWTKPSLGLFLRNGSRANNILLQDSGVSVFERPGGWGMVTSNGAYTSADGLRWRRLPFRAVAEDDTKPTARWDGRLGKYVVMVRRDCGGGCVRLDGSPVRPRPGAVRYVGRCETSNLSDWQSEVPGGGGCPVVFGPDAQDPADVDVYTNAWTPVPSVADPIVHVMFPSFYRHFGPHAPFGFANDGLLDIRLVVSRDGVQWQYAADARSGRSPFVPLGPNRCGGAAHAPGNVGGWCDPVSGVESRTAFDTSAAYMADGYVPAADGTLLFYASGQPMTHGGDAANQTWGPNTGIRVRRAPAPAAASPADRGGSRC